MADEMDWSLTTWEGNRLRQHREFYALPFREKMLRIEGLGEISLLLLNHARARLTASPLPARSE